MGTFEVISIILNALFGGGLLIQFITMRSVKAKAKADAETAKAKAERLELDNVDKAIVIWREMAMQLKKELEQSREKYAEVTNHVDALRREVKRLTETSNKILKLLDRITPENLEKMKEQIKEELNGKEN